MHRLYSSTSAHSLRLAVLLCYPPCLLQADYQLDQLEEVVAINVAAAKLAKKACADYMAAHPGSLKFAAGAIGPTNKTLSVSPSVENPALRGVTYDEIEQAYYEQAKALWEGGVDMFLVETIFDTGNAKAAIYALERFFEEQVGGRGAAGCLICKLESLQQLDMCRA